MKVGKYVWIELNFPLYSEPITILTRVPRVLSLALFLLAAPWYHLRD